MKSSEKISEHLLRLGRIPWKKILKKDTVHLRVVFIIDSSLKYQSSRILWTLIQEFPGFFCRNWRPLRLLGIFTDIPPWKAVKTALQWSRNPSSANHRPSFQTHPIPSPPEITAVSQQKTLRTKKSAPTVMAKEKTTRIPTMEKLTFCFLMDSKQFSTSSRLQLKWFLLWMHILYDLETFEHTIPYHVKSTCTFTVLHYVLKLTADETGSHPSGCATSHLDNLISSQCKGTAKRMCCPRTRWSIQREAKKRGRRKDFGHWGSWSFVMLGSWVLDRTTSQTLNLKP